MFTVNGIDNLDHFITVESLSHDTGIRSFTFPHLTPMVIAELERLQVFCALYLTPTVPAVSLLILCVETLGRINPILWPRFMPLPDVTVLWKDNDSSMRSLEFFP